MLFFFFPENFFRWHRLSPIQSWASPSYRALFLQTLTPLWPQTTLLLRWSVPRTTRWSSIVRGTPLSHIHVWRRKVFPSPSTRSSTYPCFSSTVRCPSALRYPRQIRNFHQYVVSFLHSLSLLWIVSYFHLQAVKVLVIFSEWSTIFNLISNKSLSLSPLKL